MVFVRAHSSLLSDQQSRRGGGRGAGYFAESDSRKPARVAAIRGKWRTLQAESFLFPSVLAYLLQMIGPSRAGIGGAVRTRRHRHNSVFALFAVEVFHTQQHLVLCQAELRLVAYRQKHGMLRIFRPDSVDPFLRLEQVFLAEQFQRLLVTG